MELVDMRDLGSRAAMRVGSSPFRRTMLKATFWFFEPECSFFIFPPSMINWLTVCIMEGFLCFSM